MYVNQVRGVQESTCFSKNFLLILVRTALCPSLWPKSLYNDTIERGKSRKWDCCVTVTLLDLEQGIQYILLFHMQYSKAGHIHIIRLLNDRLFLSCTAYYMEYNKSIPLSIFDIALTWCKCHGQSQVFTFRDDFIIIYGMYTPFFQFISMYLNCSGYLTIFLKEH